MEVTLANVGEDAYRPEVYGEAITVVRTVTASSSTYKYKDARGREVKVKKGKQEIDDVLSAFQIQVRRVFP